MEPAVNIDDDSDSHRRLRGSDADGEEGEEEAFELPREKQAVEHREVDVNSIEDKFDGDEHRDQVATCHEAEDPDKKQQSAENEEKFYWYHITCPFLR